MGADTKIGWADHTFNPWRGCSGIATGCRNCYAAEMSNLNPAVLGRWGKNGTRVVASESMWQQPLKWNAAARRAGRIATVFCASLADVFEDWQQEVRDANGAILHRCQANHWQSLDSVFARGTECVSGCELLSRPAHVSDVRRRLFALIDVTPHLMWLLLTKRPENISAMMPPYFPGGYIAEAGAMNQEGPRPNVMLGTSISTQADADKNIPAILKCRDLCAGLFVSAEPLLEDVDIVPWIGGHSYWCSECKHWKRTENEMAYVGGSSFACVECGTWCPPGTTLDWLIVGGESGRGQRPMPLDACRSLVDQCREVGVPCFVKQDSGPKEGQRGRLPDDVWSVKEFPEVIRSVRP